MDLATQTSQDLNPAYGYTWCANTREARWLRSGDVGWARIDGQHRSRHYPVRGQT
jgi:hypothetical protein